MSLFSLKMANFAHVALCTIIIVSGIVKIAVSPLSRHHLQHSMSMTALLCELYIMCNGVARVGTT